MTTVHSRSLGKEVADPLSYDISSSTSKRRRLNRPSEQQVESTANEIPTIKSKVVTLRVQPFEWSTGSLGKILTDDLPVLIRCWCKDRLGKVNLVKFDGFCFTVYLEMSGTSADGKTIAWNMTQIRSLTKYVDTHQAFTKCRPIAHDFVKRSKLYFAGTPLVKFLRLRFNGQKQMREFAKVIRRPISLEHLGDMVFRLHEDNVKVLTKFLARVKTSCTQWMEVDAMQCLGASRLSYPSVLEYDADFETVRPVEDNTVLSCKVLSFDIEVFSKVSNRFPMPINKDDEVFAISIVTETFTPGSVDPSTRKRTCLCLGEASPISPQKARDPDSEFMEYSVETCSGEMELIERFTSLVNSEDPDVVTGHNIWGFDMKYLFIRATLIHDRPLANMSRTPVQGRTELTSTAHVPAYRQKISNEDFVCRTLDEDASDEYVYPADLGRGRLDSEQRKKKQVGVTLISLDGKLQLSKRQDPVAANPASLCEHRGDSFQTSHGDLKKKKKKNTYMRNTIHSFVMEGRVSLDTLPMCKERRLNTYTLQNVCTELMGKSKLDVSPQDIFKAYRMSVLKQPTDDDVMDAVQNAEEGADGETEATVDRYARDLYDRIIYYCVKDSDLVVDLFSVMNTWTTLMEYSRCFGVTPYESLACGQQARCLAIVYIKASSLGYVLDNPDATLAETSFVGGRVVEPIPGVYDFVMCHDFNSLYPSIIQEMNICHTTLIPPPRWAEFSTGEYISIREKDSEGGVEFRFSTRKRGIIPQLCEYLVSERKVAKSRMAQGALDGNESLRIAMDCRQKALKITANSMYGLMGADVGALRLMEGSRSITCRGRELQQMLASALRDRFDTVEIYGDTDSSMVTGRGNLKSVRVGTNPDSATGGVGPGLHLASSEQAFLLGSEMEDYLNGRGGMDGFFKHPIRVEMEKVMKMLVIHKKMYAYLEYSHSPGGGFVMDRLDKPVLTSKGLLSARRDACGICKRMFEKVVQLLLSDVLGYDLIVNVVELIKEFLACTNLDSFKRTVEVQGNYSSKTCANNVFKRNMLRMGTKIEPRSRVSYVFICTTSEISGKGRSSIGDKMLLTQYFNPHEHRLDYLHYLSSGLKKPMDEVVSIGAKDYERQMNIIGIPGIQLNRPVAAVLKLIASKSHQWDTSGIDIFLSTLHREQQKKIRART